MDTAGINKNKLGSRVALPINVTRDGGLRDSWGLVGNGEMGPVLTPA